MIAATIWLSLFVQGCTLVAPQARSVNAPHYVSKDEALITSKAAFKSRRSQADSKILVCEQSMYWAIIFDGDNIEVLIDKFSGKIVETRKVPQGYSDGDSTERVEGISEQEAVKIATNDFLATFGPKMDPGLLVLPCELAKAWRIVFDIKLTLEPGQDTPILPDAHASTYIVDKRTGKLLYRQIY